MDVLKSDELISSDNLSENFHSIVKYTVWIPTKDVLANYMNNFNGNCLVFLKDLHIAATIPRKQMSSQDFALSEQWRH